ncbi:MAG TPA: sensor histidine kinase [Sandaracinaceae bacterium LLY-WYZ-13_1]|nr:sensor histidine kinase [Sandaracinaceae bacterium LLY-WYZ-13_1]
MDTANQPDDDRAFGRFVREESRRRLERTALATTAVMITGWVVGRIVLSGQSLEAPGRIWLGLLTVVSVTAWLVFRYLPLAARHPMPFGMVTLGLIAAGGGMHVTAMSDLDGPFFYAIYILPPLTIGLPMGLASRVGMACLAPAAFAGTYFGAHPSYLEHPMIHVPVVVGGATLLVSVVLGHRVHLVVRDRFLFGRQLERQRAELARHAEHLEREVEERSRALAEASEALERTGFERADVARALHDDLGQLIVRVRMELDMLERTLARLPAQDGPTLKHLSSVVEVLDRSVRVFIDRLRDPQPVGDLGEALEALVAPLRARSDLAISTEVSVEHPLCDEAHEAVYRLVQEAVTNVFKHADARRMRISVRSRVGDVVAMVEDDGRGFDAAAASEGLGLRGLRERAAALDGTLTIDAGESGTRVRLRFPRTRLREVAS